MHVPDGFLNAPVSIGTGVLAAGCVAVCLRHAREEMDERAAPMAGLVSAFVFAAQMINFPVGAGTSGHLLGGALAAILVGPFTGTLCVTVVLIAQALFFADGGLTALGANVLLIAVVPAFVGYGVFKLVARGSRGKASVTVGSFLAALFSVPVAALVFAVLFWLGGTDAFALSTVAAAMGGVHVIIGIGEGLITAVVVGAVLATRPDLVYGARHLVRPVVPETAGKAPEKAGQTPETAEPPQIRRRPVGSLAIAGIVASAVIAGFLSFFASSSPDGLERVAEDIGFADRATDHDLAGSPLGDYGESAGLPVGLAGIIGVAVTLAVGGGLGYVVRRRAVPAQSDS